MKTVAIVSQYRAEHGARPRFTAPATATPAPDKKPFVPFPVGTVRGPFTCGKGTDPEGGVQYLVQTSRGWVPFIDAARSANETEQAAHAFAKGAK